MRFLQSWKVYIWFLTAITIVLVGLTIYTTITVTGTDSGLSVVAALAYLIGAITFLALSILLGRWLKTHPRILNVYLGLFWLTLPFGSISTAFFLQSNIQRNARNDDIIAAFGYCTIEKVTWNYEPARLLIEYTDRDPIQIDIRTDPAFVEGQVSAQKLRCDATYEFLMNGRAQN